MIINYEINMNTELTPEQVAQIEYASQKEVVADEDNPILTSDQLKKFRRVNGDNLMHA